MGTLAKISYGGSSGFLLEDVERKNVTGTGGTCDHTHVVANSIGPNNAHETREDGLCFLVGP